MRGIAYTAVELGGNETPIEAADELQRDPGIPPAPITRVLDSGPVKAIGAVAHHDLAAWALATEMGDGRELEDLHIAAERACQKLCQPLSALVTVEGYRALLARAIQVAAVEFPFLDESSKGPSTSSPCLGNIATSDGILKSTVLDGLTAVLAGVIGLSITFIGEGLTVRAVREVWPDAPAIGPDGLRQENQQ